MDIEPCWWCGRDAKSQWFLARHWVGCSDKFQCGSRGPCANTPEDAIAAWNRVVGQRWRPIETAEHGKEYLLYSPATDSTPAKMEVHAASWGWRTDTVSNMSYHGSATDWFPLPEPPEGETDGY